MCPLYDKYGLHLVTAFSTFTVALCVFLLPFGHSVFPGLLCIQTVLNSATIIALFSPMLVVYVADQSKGLAGSYSMIVGALTNILFNFGYLSAF